MLTRLTISKFKRFEHVEIELGNHVVFIGPNNSGKSTALQALTLWDVGLRRWQEKRSSKETPAKRSGVAINRRDLFSVPVPESKLLWKDLHTRDVSVVDEKRCTKNVRIEIIVSGVHGATEWECGLEFDYGNQESIYCRPLKDARNGKPRQSVPVAATEVQIAYLPPMSGLAAQENRLDPGAISVHLGEGRTAEVLRNLCYQVRQRAEEGYSLWLNLVNKVEKLFGARLEEPEYITARGEIRMRYRERHGAILDITSSGRGLQQTVLLLAHLYANPATVLLLDEPDAHLEILRQRQIYQVLTDVAREQGSQIIAASHSGILLNEAADRDVVVAFVGTPHRIDDRGSQVLKSLNEIGFDQFYLAEQAGFVLYLEGSTDFAILRAFAEKLGHKASEALDRPFVHYIGNQLNVARSHFHGLREGKRDLVGLALVDRDAVDTQPGSSLVEYKWQRREIENYVCQRETLVAFATAFAHDQAAGPLFNNSETGRIVGAMEATIEKIEDAMLTLEKGSPWSVDAKVSDDFLAPLFQEFYKRLGLHNLMQKSDFHELARFVPVDLIDTEVKHLLDRIVEVAEEANPAA